MYKLIKLIATIYFLLTISTGCTQVNSFTPLADCGTNIVMNPSFEDPNTVVETAYLPQITSWSIDIGGSIEVDKSWQAQDGKQSIDLNPLSLGAISQNIRTKPNQSYQLIFYMAGNPTEQTKKKLEVIWGDNSLGIFEFDNDSTTTKTDMKWQKKIINIPSDFTTSEITKLGFLSATPGSAGAVIDNISVKCN